MGSGIASPNNHIERSPVKPFKKLTEAGIILPFKKLTQGRLQLGGFWGLWD